MLFAQSSFAWISTPIELPAGGPQSLSGQIFNGLIKKSAVYDQYGIYRYRIEPSKDQPTTVTVTTESNILEDVATSKYRKVDYVRFACTNDSGIYKCKMYEAHNQQGINNLIGEINNLNGKSHLNNRSAPSRKSPNGAPSLTQLTAADGTISCVYTYVPAYGDAGTSHTDCEYKSNVPDGMSANLCFRLNLNYYDSINEAHQLEHKAEFNKTITKIEIQTLYQQAVVALNVSKSAGCNPVSLRH